MIELAAGGLAECDSADLEAGGRGTAARLGVLALAFGLVTLPAAVGLLALLGVLR